MTYAKKPQTAPPSKEKKAAPVKYQLGNVVLMEWSNTNNEGGVYPTYSMEKFFKRDGKDDWEVSTTFNLIELRRLHLLLGHRIAQLDTESVIVKDPKSA